MEQHTVKRAYAIETTGLTKFYGTFEAVRGLTMRVPAGTITGFLGQNGAGKSSTIRMLLGMMKPTAGTGSVLDFDIADERQSIEMRKRVAYVGEDKRLYDYMTVGQMIAFTKSFYPTWNDDVEKKLLEEFRLPLDRPTKNSPRECGLRPRCCSRSRAVRSCSFLTSRPKVSIR